MNAPVDVSGILERAGADADAPQGSQGWALAQVGAAVVEMVAALDQAATSMQDSGYPNSHPAVMSARAALARVGEVA